MYALNGSSNPKFNIPNSNSFVVANGLKLLKLLNVLPGSHVTTCVIKSRFYSKPANKINQRVHKIKTARVANKLKLEFLAGGVLKIFN